jgi:hypothetical protein
MLKYNYYLKYESVYSNSEVGEEFRKHLKKEVNQDSFDFILFVDTDKDLEINEVYETYIKVGSKKEINISSENREEFEKILKKSMENQRKDLKVFLKEISNLVKKELECDSFPRFLRTEQCLKLLEKYQKDEKVCGSMKKKQYPYTEKDFKEKFITEKDIHFLNEVKKENYDWELLSFKLNRINSFFSPKCEEPAKFVNFKILWTFKKYFNISIIVRADFILYL